MCGCPSNSGEFAKKCIGVNDLCPCCGFESKTLFHSIIKCEVARRVWDNWEDSSVENWQGLVDISNVALDILKNGTNCDFEVFFGVAWSVWYNRNQGVNCWVRFGGLLGVFYKIIKVLCLL